MIDLHIHTNHSDGTECCEDILYEVISRGIEVFSVTDHDVTSGSREMSELLKGVKNPPRLISGVEISAIHNGFSCHLLGYGFDLDNPSMVAMLRHAKELRREKLGVTLAYLEQAQGIGFSKEERDWLYSLSLAGKPHICRLLIKRGYGKNVFELLPLFDGCKTPNLKIEAAEAISVVHTAGGVVSLAHPRELTREYGFTYSQIEDFCRKLKAISLDALEVFHSTHAQGDIAAYKDMAKRLSLYASVGSDYHGTLKDVPLGMFNQERLPIEDSEVTILSVIS